jgi:hypothetical protein
MCIKRRFQKRKHANKEAAHMEIKYNRPYRIYVCFECNCFHITHKNIRRI